MQEIGIYKEIWMWLLEVVHSPVMIWLVRMLIFNAVVCLLIFLDRVYYKYNWKERIIRFKDEMIQEE